MKPVFEIIPEAIFFLQTTLICEVSPDSFSCIFVNDAGKKIHGLYEYYLDKDKDITTQLHEIFSEQPLLGKQYKKVFISYACNENALLPAELYRAGSNQQLMDTLYGDLEEGTITTDLIAGKKIYNVYRVPSAIHHSMVEKFPVAVFYHQYSLLIKQEWVGNLLRVIFYRDRILVILVKEGELQIIHSFPYQSPTDVVYHLLNVVKQFQVNNIEVKAGGKIDPGAYLYKEVSHYFNSISLDDGPAGFEYNKALEALPAHYFSHLYSLASCV